MGKLVVVGSAGAVLAYTPGGVLLWSNRYNGPFNRNDCPNAIAVTSEGIIVVTGYSDLEGLGNVSDAVTIAYSSEGLSTNWVTVPGSALTNRVGLAPASDCGCFRLFNP